MQHMHDSEVVIPAAIASKLRGMHPNDAFGAAALSARRAQMDALRMEAMLEHERMQRGHQRSVVLLAVALTVLAVSAIACALGHL